MHCCSRSRYVSKAGRASTTWRCSRIGSFAPKETPAPSEDRAGTPGRRGMDNFVTQRTTMWCSRLNIEIEIGLNAGLETRYLGYTIASLVGASKCVIHMHRLKAHRVNCTGNFHQRRGVWTYRVQRRQDRGSSRRHLYPLRSTTNHDSDVRTLLCVRC